MMGRYRQASGLLQSRLSEKHLQGKLTKLCLGPKPKSQLSDNLGNQFRIQALLAKAGDRAKHVVFA
jgi:hypothetical protein